MSGRRVREIPLGRHAAGSPVVSDARAVYVALSALAGTVGLFHLAAKAGGTIGVAVVAVLGALVLLGHALPDQEKS